MNTIISSAIPEVQLIQITSVIPITIHILPSTVTDVADYSLVQRGCIQTSLTEKPKKQGWRPIGLRQYQSSNAFKIVSEQYKVSKAVLHSKWCISKQRAQKYALKQFQRQRTNISKTALNSKQFSVYYVNIICVRNDVTNVDCPKQCFESLSKQSAQGDIPLKEFPSTPK